MKGSRNAILFSFFLIVVTLFGCSDDSETIGKDIPPGDISEYSPPCLWNKSAVVSNRVLIINSEAELDKLLLCELETSEINFVDHSVLVVSGPIPFAVKDKRMSKITRKLVQETKSEYTLRLEIVFEDSVTSGNSNNNTTDDKNVNSDGVNWYVALETLKIQQNTMINLVINYVAQ
ncbi:hypothetical protein D0T53_09095 [Dysgonomonas sp. 216]|uniref:hypothetical protein n=1 Tax=Dysgonomonas sp. 216 TaxID=2302934 RepID=UPI0013D584F3|nr:hypothetical protein [Dysgonomonas sp. 216]NDW19067.1 hypothetical protein [Dysgonomonas sp. 216]